MTRERWEEIAAHGGWVNLSDRAKWKLTGGDRVRYLNGQMTQDVRKATPSKAVYTCVTDVKGRICGDGFVRVTDDGEALLLDAEPELAESLGMRLERYIIADDVELVEVTGGWGLWHVFGEAVAEVEGVACERFGVPGKDVWLPAGERPGFTVEAVLPEEVEVLRVLRGVPRFPNELNADVFPPEAGLEDRAMDFTKGCYIGQEILSRIRTTGKMPRKLVRWSVEAGAAEIGPGAVIQAVDGSAVGLVTSRIIDPRGGCQAGLGYVKQAHAIDSELLVGGVMSSIAASSQIP